MTERLLTLETQGSLVRLSVSMPPTTPKGVLVGGGKRGTVSEFSHASRRRLLRLLATLDPAQKYAFLTLTYPADFPDVENAKTHLRAFYKRLKRKNDSLAAIWRLEFQRRGAPHFHLILMNWEYIPQYGLLEFWQEVTGAEVKLLDIRMVQGDPQTALRYAAKYSAKRSTYLDNSAYLAAHPNTNIGRHWGSYNLERARYATYNAVAWQLPFDVLINILDSVVREIDLKLEIDRKGYAPETVSYFADDTLLIEIDASLERAWAEIGGKGSFFDLVSGRVGEYEPNFSIVNTNPPTFLEDYPF